MFFNRVFKILLIALVAFIFATVATAFAASNTVPAGYAGDGSGAISGYVVSNVQYNLNTTNPANIDSVTFTLDHAATAVSIQLNGSAWIMCSISGGTSVTCPGSGTTGVTAAAANSLRVVATQ